MIMEPVNLVYVGILLLMVCLALTVLLLVVYSGLLYSIDVGAGKPPIEDVLVAYKFARGPYKDCGHLFTEALALAPNNRTIGIYYDDPKEVSPRYIVGSVLAEGKSDPDEALKSKFLKEGYSFRNFPSVTNAVKSSFPHKSTLSIFIAVARVYPKLCSYITDNKLCAHPFIEIYDGETIQFMAPLSRQEEFYVPETKTTSNDETLSSDATCTDMSSLSEPMEGSLLSDVDGLDKAAAGETIETPAVSSLPCELPPCMGNNYFPEAQKYSDVSASLNDSGISSENAQVHDSSLSDGPAKGGDMDLGAETSFEEIHLDTTGLSG